ERVRELAVQAQRLLELGVEALVVREQTAAARRNRRRPARAAVNGVEPGARLVGPTQPDERLDEIRLREEWAREDVDRHRAASRAIERRARLVEPVKAELEQPERVGHAGGRDGGAARPQQRPYLTRSGARRLLVPACRLDAHEAGDEVRLDALLPEV